MPSYYQWKSLRKIPCASHKYPSFEVSNHPLSSTVKQSSSKDFLEKLNKWSNAIDQSDPLMRFEQLDLEENFETVEISQNKQFGKIWMLKRACILNKYTTGEKLTITSSFLPGGEKALIRQVSNLNEKVKHRLEQLDDFEEGTIRKTMGLSQQEFVTKINVLNEEIKKAWDTEQRVKAFKIAIQCSKLLSDTNVMQFYPSKYVLITDILDTFGDMVFERLSDKSFGSRQIKNVKDIDPKQVPEQAKETCQNWMYKMASIRELLPRLFMEIALVKCYAFLSKTEIKSCIERLTTMIRGVADPLVALYLRVYLCRVAAKTIDDADRHFYDNLKEFLDDYYQIFIPAYKSKHENQSLCFGKYIGIHIPAIELLITGTLCSNRCKSSLMKELLECCRGLENNELLLLCILTSFDAQNVISEAQTILELIQKSADQMVLINDVLASLGEHLCTVDGYQQVPCETLIQTWWPIASSLEYPNHFLQVLEPWLEFACKHLSSQHVNIILRGTIRYMVKCGKPADDFSGHFQLVFKRMLKSIPDVEELMLMDAFMPLVELVQTTSARTMMAKTVLKMFFDRYTRDHIEDPIVIGSLMRLSCIIHDSITAVTVEDESKACAESISRFIQAVHYADDCEQQLNFYVECRAAFLKLDAVLVVLVHAVSALSARRAPGTSGTTGAWLWRACAAYCYITVPSLRCGLARAALYLLAGQAALLNRCLGQAEANFKALVSVIPDIPEFIVEDGQKKPTSTKVAALMSDFCSTLLLLPDNVESNCMAYILSGLIKTIERIHWRKTDSLYYTTLLNILDLLCSMTHEDYAYHIKGVLSNDVLYGSDPEFLEALDNHATNICQELLSVMKSLGEAGESKKQCNLCIELFWRVVTKGDLEQDSMFSLATNLWSLSEKLRTSDAQQKKLAKNILVSLNNEARPGCKRLLQKLMENSG